MVRAPSVNAPQPVATTPVARRRPAALRVAIAAVVIIGASILRPWGDSAPPRSSPAAGRASPPAVANVAEAATASPAPSLASDQIACSSTDWQLVSLDHLGTWTVRSWIPANAVRAEGPLDPSIRPVTMESPEVLAIGACSPATSDDAGRDLPGGPAHLVRAWRIKAGHATPVSLSVHRDEPLPGVATLYNLTGTPPRPATGVAAWPAGEFVVEVAPVGLPDGPAAVPGSEAGPDPDTGAPSGWFVGLVVRGPG